MLTLGNFRRIVGSSADMSELEYISSLHQTILPNLREDGTISANDIAVYLKSRYGLYITSGEAVDIACELCGAKRRSKFNKQVQPGRDADEVDLAEEDNEEDDDDYRFDLVQVASLLLIPEIIEYAEARKTGNDDGSERGIFGEVIESLIEPLDEVVEDEIRGDAPLTLELLGKILMCGGDEDTAKDTKLMEQMLEDLGGEGAPLNVDTFISALISDVAPAFASSEKKGERDDEHRVSTFFDVFGFNWEDGAPATESDDGGLKLEKTKPFIDYAVDSYNSMLYNTCVWSLFLLTTLIYGNFIRAEIKSGASGLVCDAGSEHFGCKVGHHVIVWILVALFCGVYGLFFLLPTSAGNVPGQKGWLLFSILVTGTFCFAPFAGLMIYNEGIPHDNISTNKHSIICPGDAFTLLNPNVSMFDLLPDGASLKMDDQCKRLRDWCSDHKEAQGKYVDSNPKIFSEQEFDKCVDFLDTEVPNFFYFMSGQPCEDIWDCQVGGHIGECGLEALSEPNYKTVCCLSGRTVSYVDMNGSNVTLCSNQPLGATCFSDDMCDSGLCDLGLTQCILKEAKPCTRNCPAGTECRYETASKCSSGFCYKGTCAFEPEVCLNDYGNWMNGYVIDPFCRVPEVWCELNDVTTLYLTFLFIDTYLGEYVNLTEKNLTELDPCTGSLTVLTEYDVGGDGNNNTILKIVNETTENLQYTDDYADYDSVERVLTSYWSYFVLIATAAFGGLAFLAQLSTVRGMYADERPRDHAVKCAAKAKMSKLIGNALSLHGDKDSDLEGMTMRNYFLSGRKFVDVGGLGWTIKKMHSGDLVMSEGIHIPGRVYIGMVCQIAVLIIGIIVAVGEADYVGSSFQELRDDISKTYTNDEVQDIKDYDWVKYDDEELTLTSTEETILEYIPEQWMIHFPVAVASVFACLVALFCILVYIPSYVNTVLKLRCGKMPSLRDPYIRIIRTMGDGVVTNVGNMVFSLMGASFMTFLIVFTPIFVVCWPVTRDAVLTISSIAIGIAATNVIKIVGQSFFRARNFRGLYRLRPASANIVNVFFECWYTGIGLLVILTRLAIFIVAGALWLGRIDVEFLHPDVKVMGVGLDAIPISFKRDMLVHEAHSHPYIDRLGGMYLRRLRHGEKFGSVSGSTWRALFAVGLMPWLIKHRVQTDEISIMEETTKETGAGIEVEAVEAAK